MTLPSSLRLLWLLWASSNPRATPPSSLSAYFPSNTEVRGAALSFHSSSRTWWYVMATCPESTWNRTKTPYGITCASSVGGSSATALTCKLTWGYTLARSPSTAYTAPTAQPWKEILRCTLFPSTKLTGRQSNIWYAQYENIRTIGISVWRRRRSPKVKLNGMLSHHHNTLWHLCIN